MGILFDITHLFEKKSKYHLDVVYEVPEKLSWWYAPVYTTFWTIIFVAVVLSLSINLPTPLMVKDEANAPDRFIAERAQTVLLGLTQLGPRVVGSEANEVRTVNFLLGEVEKVRAQASDYFEIETDVQVVTGNYMHWEMINMYQGVQNVVVKLSAKGGTSDNYLLINSHFDTVPESTGGGDDGSMVSIMLEVMRVIAKSDGPLEHPIVFLFNGAEENPLQASHGFITQHKWAKNCRALINLDAAGNSGKEVLFQSGPNHPWLMRYYRKHALHPFATTMGEEVFQANLIPSDTDFRIFRDYGAVPGLDLAYIYNGYVYHTKYDRFNIVPLGSLQNTGDNVLGIARAIANAPEMYNTSEHEEGHVVFYDFVGWFMMFYSLTVSCVINVVVCCVGLIAIGVSMFFMMARSGLSALEITKRFGTTIGLQILSLLLGAGLTLLMAVFMDGVNRSLSWLSETWLIFGLFFCPMFFGMGIVAAIYAQYMKNDKLSLGFRIQLFMHAHCIFLVLLCIILTCVGIRSAFMPMLAVFFDILALIVNLATKWHRRGYLFAVAVIVCQILPFIYFTNIAYSVFYTMIPMMGRNGSGMNPDIMMAGVTIFMSVLFAGFLIPLFLFFRKTRTLISIFLVTAIVFLIIAVTPAGFPYEPKLAAQRFSLIHAKRIFHDADSSVRNTGSGIYIYPQDRRTSTVDDIVPGYGSREKLSSFCQKEMFCGIPLYNHRWFKARERSYWIPFADPSLPITPTLELLSKEVLNATTARFEFKLTGTDHMTLFIGTKNDAKVRSWSFNDTMIRENWEQPYFVYYSYGKDSTPLEFFIHVEKTEGTFTDTSLEIGIGGHWVHHNIPPTKEYQEFLDSFPSWSVVTSWVASYETWLF